jgi:hypothetical protein
MRLWELHLCGRHLGVSRLLPEGGSARNAGGADGAGGSGHHTGRADIAPGTAPLTPRRSVQTSLVVVVRVWNWCGRLHHLLSAPGWKCELLRNERVSLGDGAPERSERVWLHHRPGVMGDGRDASRGILGSLVDVVAAWNWSGRFHLLLDGLEAVWEWSKPLKRVLLDWGGRWWELRVLVGIHDC